jgi:hypothetical protein
MDKQRKRIVSAFIVFLGVIVLFFFLIVGYAIHEGHIAGYGDVFRNEADTEEAVWVRLAIVALVNLFAFVSIIFSGLLIFFKGKKNS